MTGFTFTGYDTGPGYDTDRRLALVQLVVLCFLVIFFLGEEPYSDPSQFFIVC